MNSEQPQLNAAARSKAAPLRNRRPIDGGRQCKSYTAPNPLFEGVSIVKDSPEALCSPAGIDDGMSSTTVPARIDDLPPSLYTMTPTGGPMPLGTTDETVQPPPSLIRALSSVQPLVTAYEGALEAIEAIVSYDQQMLRPFVPITFHRHRDAIEEAPMVATNRSIMTTASGGIDVNFFIQGKDFGLVNMTEQEHLTSLLEETRRRKELDLSDVVQCLESCLQQTILDMTEGFSIFLSTAGSETVTLEEHSEQDCCNEEAISPEQRGTISHISSKSISTPIRNDPTRQKSAFHQVTDEEELNAKQALAAWLDYQIVKDSSYSLYLLGKNYFSSSNASQQKVTSNIMQQLCPLVQPLHRQILALNTTFSPNGSASEIDGSAEKEAANNRKCKEKAAHDMTVRCILGTLVPTPAAFGNQLDPSDCKDGETQSEGNDLSPCRQSKHLQQGLLLQCLIHLFQPLSLNTLRLLIDKCRVTLLKLKGIPAPVANDDKLSIIGLCEVFIEVMDVQTATYAPLAAAATYQEKVISPVMAKFRDVMCERYEDYRKDSTNTSETVEAFLSHQNSHKATKFDGKPVTEFPFSQESHNSSGHNVNTLCSTPGSASTAAPIVKARPTRALRPGQQESIDGTLSLMDSVTSSSPQPHQILTSVSSTKPIQQSGVMQASQSTLSQTQAINREPANVSGVNYLTTNNPSFSPNSMPAEPKNKTAWICKSVFRVPVPLNSTLNILSQPPYCSSSSLLEELDRLVVDALNSSYAILSNDTIMNSVTNTINSMSPGVIGGGLTPTDIAPGPQRAAGAATISLPIDFGQKLLEQFSLSEILSISSPPDRPTSLSRLIRFNTEGSIRSASKDLDYLDKRGQEERSSLYDDTFTGRQGNHNSISSHGRELHRTVPVVFTPSSDNDSSTNFARQFIITNGLNSFAKKISKYCLSPAQYSSIHQSNPKVQTSFNLISSDIMRGSYSTNDSVSSILDSSYLSDISTKVRVAEVLTDTSEQDIYQLADCQPLVSDTASNAAVVTAFGACPTAVCAPYSKATIWGGVGDSLIRIYGAASRTSTETSNNSGGAALSIHHSLVSSTPTVADLLKVRSAARPITNQAYVVDHYGASHIELTFTGTFISRSDMMMITERFMRNRIFFIGEEFKYDGFTAMVSGMKRPKDSKAIQFFLEREAVFFSSSTSSSTQMDLHSIGRRRNAIGRDGKSLKAALALLDAEYVEKFNDQANENQRLRKELLQWKDNTKRKMQSNTPDIPNNDDNRFNSGGKGSKINNCGERKFNDQSHRMRKHEESFELLNEPRFSQLKTPIAADAPHLTPTLFEDIKCGYVTKNTIVNFESLNFLEDIMIELSSEMWEPATDGRVHLDWALDRYLKDHVDYLKKYNAVPRVRLVFFGVLSPSVAPYILSAESLLTADDKVQLGGHGPSCAASTFTVNRTPNYSNVLPATSQFGTFMPSNRGTRPVSTSEPVSPEKTCLKNTPTAATADSIDRNTGDLRGIFHTTWFGTYIPKDVAPGELGETLEGSRNLAKRTRDKEKESGGEMKKTDEKTAEEVLAEIPATSKLLCNQFLERLQELYRIGKDAAQRNQVLEGEEALCDTPSRNHQIVDANALFVPSKYANILQAVNMCLDAFDMHHIDRDLFHTGQTITVVSAGKGYYAVNHQLSQLTATRFLDIGVQSCRIVCIGRPPLHLTPLFEYAGNEPALHQNKGIKGSCVDDMGSANLGRLPRRRYNCHLRSSRKPYNGNALCSFEPDKLYYEQPQWATSLFYHPVLRKGPVGSHVQFCLWTKSLWVVQRNLLKAMTDKLNSESISARSTFITGSPWLDMRLGMTFAGTRRDYCIAALMKAPHDNPNVTKVKPERKSNQLGLRLTLPPGLDRAIGSLYSTIGDGLLQCANLLLEDAKDKHRSSRRKALNQCAASETSSLDVSASGCSFRLAHTSSMFPPTPPHEILYDDIEPTESTKLGIPCPAKSLHSFPVAKSPTQVQHISRRRFIFFRDGSAALQFSPNKEYKADRKVVDNIGIRTEARSFDYKDSVFSRKQRVCPFIIPSKDVIPMHAQLCRSLSKSHIFNNATAKIAAKNGVINISVGKGSTIPSSVVSPSIKSIDTETHAVPNMALLPNTTGIIPTSSRNGNCSYPVWTYPTYQCGNSNFSASYSMTDLVQSTSDNLTTDIRLQSTVKRDPIDLVQEWSYPNFSSFSQEFVTIKRSRVEATGPSPIEIIDKNSKCFKSTKFSVSSKPHSSTYRLPAAEPLSSSGAYMFQSASSMHNGQSVNVIVKAAARWFYISLDDENEGMSLGTGNIDHIPRTISSSSNVPATNFDGRNARLNSNLNQEISLEARTPSFQNFTPPYPTQDSVESFLKKEEILPENVTQKEDTSKHPNGKANYESASVPSVQIIKIEALGQELLESDIQGGDMRRFGDEPEFTEGTLMLELKLSAEIVTQEEAIHGIQQSLARQYSHSYTTQQTPTEECSVSNPWDARFSNQSNFQHSLYNSLSLSSSFERVTHDHGTSLQTPVKVHVSWNEDILHGQATWEALLGGFHVSGERYSPPSEHPSKEDGSVIKDVSSKTLPEIDRPCKVQLANEVLDNDIYNGLLTEENRGRPGICGDDVVVSPFLALLPNIFVRPTNDVSKKDVNSPKDEKTDISHRDPLFQYRNPSIANDGASLLLPVYRSTRYKGTLPPEIVQFGLSREMLSIELHEVEEETPEIEASNTPDDEGCKSCIDYFTCSKDTHLPQSKSLLYERMNEYTVDNRTSREYSIPGSYPYGYVRDIINKRYGPETSKRMENKIVSSIEIQSKDGNKCFSNTSFYGKGYHKWNLDDHHESHQKTPMDDLSHEPYITDTNLTVFFSIPQTVAVIRPRFSMLFSPRPIKPYGDGRSDIRNEKIDVGIANGNSTLMQTVNRIHVLLKNSEELNARMESSEEISRFLVLYNNSGTSRFSPFKTQSLFLSYLTNAAQAGDSEMNIPLLNMYSLRLEEKLKQQNVQAKRFYHYVRKAVGASQRRAYTIVREYRKQKRDEKRQERKRELTTIPESLCTLLENTRRKSEVSSVERHVSNVKNKRQSINSTSHEENSRGEYTPVNGVGESKKTADTTKNKSVGSFAKKSQPRKWSDRHNIYCDSRSLALCSMMTPEFIFYMRWGFSHPRLITVKGDISVSAASVEKSINQLNNLCHSQLNKHEALEEMVRHFEHLSGVLWEPLTRCALMPVYQFNPQLAAIAAGDYPIRRCSRHIQGELREKEWVKVISLLSYLGTAAWGSSWRKIAALRNNKCSHSTYVKKPFNLIKSPLLNIVSSKGISPIIIAPQSEYFQIHNCDVSLVQRSNTTSMIVNIVPSRSLSGYMGSNLSSFNSLLDMRQGIRTGSSIAPLSTIASTKDNVCVTNPSRMQTIQQNKAASFQNSATHLNFSPSQCKITTSDDNGRSSSEGMQDSTRLGTSTPLLSSIVLHAPASWERGTLLNDNYIGSLKDLMDRFTPQNVRLLGVYYDRCQMRNNEIAESRQSYSNDDSNLYGSSSDNDNFSVENEQMEMDHGIPSRFYTSPQPEVFSYKCHCISVQHVVEEALVTEVTQYQYISAIKMRLSGASSATEFFDRHEVRRRMAHQKLIYLIMKVIDSPSVVRGVHESSINISERLPNPVESEAKQIYSLDSIQLLIQSILGSGNCDPKPVTREAIEEAPPARLISLAERFPEAFKTAEERSCLVPLSLDIIQLIDQDIFKAVRSICNYRGDMLSRLQALVRELILQRTHQQYQIISLRQDRLEAVLTLNHQVHHLSLLTLPLTTLQSKFYFDDIKEFALHSTMAEEHTTRSKSESSFTSTLKYTHQTEENVPMYMDPPLGVYIVVRRKCHRGMYEVPTDQALTYHYSQYNTLTQLPESAKVEFIAHIGPRTMFPWQEMDEIVVSPERLYAHLKHFLASSKVASYGVSNINAEDHLGGNETAMVNNNIKRVYRPSSLPSNADRMLSVVLSNTETLGSKLRQRCVRLAIFPKYVTRASLMELLKKGKMYDSVRNDSSGECNFEKIGKYYDRRPGGSENDDLVLQTSENPYQDESMISPGLRLLRHLYGKSSLPYDKFSSFIRSKFLNLLGGDELWKRDDREVTTADPEEFHRFCSSLKEVVSFNRDCEMSPVFVHSIDRHNHQNRKSFLESELSNSSKIDISCPSNVLTTPALSTQRVNYVHRFGPICSYSPYFGPSVDDNDVTDVISVSGTDMVKGQSREGLAVHEKEQAARITDSRDFVLLRYQFEEPMKRVCLFQEDGVAYADHAADSISGLTRYNDLPTRSRYTSVAVEISPYYNPSCFYMLEISWLMCSSALVGEWIRGLIANAATAGYQATFVPSYLNPEAIDSLSTRVLMYRPETQLHFRVLIQILCCEAVVVLPCELEQEGSGSCDAVPLASRASDGTSVPLESFENGNCQQEHQTIPDVIMDRKIEHENLGTTTNVNKKNKRVKIQIERNYWGDYSPRMRLYRRYRPSVAVIDRPCRLLHTSGSFIISVLPDCSLRWSLNPQLDIPTGLVNNEMAQWKCIVDDTLPVIVEVLTLIFKKVFAEIECMDSD